MRLRLAFSLERPLEFL